MDKIIDLHTHSTASDGSMSPKILVRYAKEMGLAAVAVTDHDTIEGINEALTEGEKLGIEVIAGVEIGVDYTTEMHILGYFFERDYLNIQDTLSELKKNRDERNVKVVRKLRELGFDISLDEVTKEGAGGIIGRPHFAKVLKDKGYAKSTKEAFDKYLSKGKVAYFKKDRLSLKDGINKICEAGGIPVIAYPKYLKLTFSQLDKLILQLIPMGLGGIEAYYTENTRDETGLFLNLAIKHKLLVTGGSDFHGHFKPDIDIGVGRGNLKVPYELLAKLKDYHNKQKRFYG